MILNILLDEKNMTRYHLSKVSNVPISTINDICSGKTKIRQSKVGTIINLANALSISVDELVALDDYANDNTDFESFTSTICHRVKSVGDLKFLYNTVSSKEIIRLYKVHKYKEALYLLAMVDYLSRVNGIPVCSEFNDIRQHKLSKVVYPSSINAMCAVFKTDSFKKESFDNSIPEFKRFNIVEVNVRDVV